MDRSHVTAILSQGGKAPGVEHVAPADVLTPADRYQELFDAVQSGRVFSDSKTFVDCVPKADPATILQHYREWKNLPGFHLANFVNDHFEAEHIPESHYVSDPNQTIGAHIDSLWDVLTRRPTDHPALSSLLPLPHDYIVPGGRFGEMYYWDSYFTMLGLAASKRPALLKTMADNFAFLIDTYGHIPNGNRSYYLSRSQPPVFALMVDLFEQHGIKRAAHFLPQLRREYDFWMDGADGLAAADAHRHVVRMPDGALLNRYWDDRDTPREEGYLEDVQTAARTSRPATEVYRDLRAGAASGWDFSSRWLADPTDLSTIRTTAILPVDLNSFLYKLETQIARLSESISDVDTATAFHTLAAHRSNAMNRYMWCDALDTFVDYDFQKDVARDEVTAASATPLYVGLATHDQAVRIAAALRSRLLVSGGVVTSELDSPQQWDRANGWAPLQWIAIGGLRRYGQRSLADEIIHRWLNTVGVVYERESKLVEKYALHSADKRSSTHREGDGTAAHGHEGDADVSGGGGGEYPLQDGFGWTNGVTRHLLHETPTHPTHQRRAQGRRRT